MTQSQRELTGLRFTSCKNTSKAEYEKIHDLEKAKINFDKYLTSQIASTFEEIQNLSTELNNLEQRERKLVSDIKNTDIDRDENALELEENAWTNEANLAQEKFI